MGHGVNGLGSQLVAALASSTVYDLGRPLFKGMPQSPNHPPYWHAHSRRHGDVVRADGTSAADDLITTGTHVGTHIDALAHISQDGRLFGGISAAESQVSGFRTLGMHTVTPIFCRGVLLDIPSVLGVETCDASHEVTPDELETACGRQQLKPRRGDVVLVRTGWGKKFETGADFVGWETGTPGVGEAGARWLASIGVRAVGAETIAFEQTKPSEGHSLLPAHRVLLVERGIHIIETMDLEALARSANYEFLFVATPLKLVSATGSPVRPLAVVFDE